jgi:cell division septation protein DedD
MDRDVLSEAKRIANEAGQLAEQLEAAETAAGVGGPTNYSSSVTSCTVDPETGNVDLRITLYPGDTPINPAPEGEREDTPVEVPPSEVPPITETPDTDTPAPVPPTDTPAPDQPAEGFEPAE